ncbi:Uncharacterised protein [Clostridioides difficile]|nr:Uncharacterised protein [Clostridioides difficile]
MVKPCLAARERSAKAHLSGHASAHVATSLVGDLVLGTPQVRVGHAYGPRTRDSGLVEQLGGDRGFGVGDAVLARLLVGHRQQPPDSTGDGVLGHRRVGELAELFQ